MMSMTITVVQYVNDYYVCTLCMRSYGFLIYLPGRGGGRRGEKSCEDRAEVLEVLCVHGPLQSLLQGVYIHT